MDKILSIYLVTKDLRYDHLYYMDKMSFLLLLHTSILTLFIDQCI